MTDSVELKNNLFEYEQKDALFLTGENANDEKKKDEYYQRRNTIK